MRETVFIEKYQKEWRRLELYFEYRNSSRRQRKKKNLVKLPITNADFPAAYRRLCNQLALAETRDFSHGLINRLNTLVIEGHRLLYRRRGASFASISHHVMVTFPQAIRREKVAMLWATALFVLPALITFLLIQFYPSVAYSFIDEDILSKMERMYSPDSDARRLGESRDSSSDVMMFGHYIMNNISIALRSFASGLIACIGAVFLTAFNGLYLGVIFSHLQNAGYASQTLYPFVITHGAFELTALVISGGAGIRLGLSLLFPQRYTRIDSVARTARELLPIVVGFVFMLIIAAFLEAFWSSIPMDKNIKYVVGSTCWVLVFAYLIQAGRKYES